MSILSVDTIQPIGSGSTVTLNAAKIVVGTGITFESNGQATYAGIITASRIVSTGQLLASIGTFTGDTAISGSLQIADTIQHEGDVNTKIRFPANDTFSVETGGSEKLRITSGGSIGIGTDDPQQDVHILRSQLSRVRIESTSTAYNSDVIFQNPDGLLGVVGYNATLDTVNIDSRGGTNGITFTRTGSEKLRITSGGQVNIGGDLTQTTYPFSVLGSTGGNTNINIVQRLKYSGDSNQYNTGTVIAFTNTNTNANAYSYIGARIDSSSSGANANALVFATNPTNTAPTERLRIGSDSNITQTIDSDGDGFIITAGDMKPMLTGNSNRSAHNNTIFGISGKWNNTEIGRIAFEAGPDTTNKDDGKIAFYTRPSGGSLTERLEIDNNGYIDVASGSHIKFTNGTWTGEHAGKIQHNSNNLYIQGGTGGIRFRHASSGVNQFSMTNGGNFEITNGDLVVAAGHGIDFSATSDASGSTSELFADYERGVHTFAVTGSSGNPTVNIASNYNKLYYTKIGDMVHVTGEMRWTISSHGSGDLQISIPFTSSSTANSNSQGTAQAWNVNWTYRSGQEQLFSEVQPGVNYMRFRIGGSNTLYEDFLDCGSTYQKTANSGYGVEYQVSLWYRTG